MNRPNTASIVGLLIGILGFATAIITNSAQLQEIAEDLKDQDTSEISGDWTWIFREYRVETNREEIAGARVTLHEKRRVITGLITTNEGRRRDWKVSGNYLVGIHPDTGTQGKFLNINYVSTLPERSQSIGSLVLKYEPSQGIYIGTLVGYDMDIGQIVIFPCILTREIDAVAKNKYNSMLMNLPSIGKQTD